MSEIDDMSGRYIGSKFDTPELEAAFVTETVLAERAFYAKPYVGSAGLKRDSVIVFRDKTNW